jgi:hypothetical protein
MNDKTYNGWTNYATWRVNLEIFDGFETSEMFALTTLEAWDLGYVLQDYAEEVVVGDMPDGLMKDYALAFLSDVNWYEIAKHMIDDAKAEAEAPTNLSNT